MLSPALHPIFPAFMMATGWSNFTIVALGLRSRLPAKLSVFSWRGMDGRMWDGEGVACGRGGVERKGKWKGKGRRE